MSKLALPARAALLLALLAWVACPLARAADPAQTAPTAAAEPPVEPAPEPPPPATDPSTPTGIATTPITGAFGVRLGEPFDPAQVALVLEQQPQAYRGPEGAKLTGIRYRIEPQQPSPCFQDYWVDTAQDGRIYAIRAEHQDPGKASVCADAKAIAAELEAKYGKPRGKAAFGEWVAFRESLEPLTRHLTFYANRCRRGIYSIAYTDDQTQRVAP